MNQRYGRWWIAAPLLLASICRAQGTSTYTISTVAGTGVTGFSGDGGAPTAAQLAGPFSVALDASGKLYIADQFNHRIRQIPPGGTIATVAGSSVSGYTGDGAAASSATLYDPTGVAVDAQGNFYIADSHNHVIRKVSSSGTISTFAGNNTTGAGYSGDGGKATDAQLNLPLGVAVDAAGNVYIADTFNNRIRKVTTDGKITTIIGSAGGFSGDGGLARGALLNAPRSIAIDSKGQLYIADTQNQRVRKVDTSGVITTIAGNGDEAYYGDGGMAVNAALHLPYGVAVDSTGAVFIADYGNSRIRKVGLNQGIVTVAGNGMYAYTGDGDVATKAALQWPTGVAVDRSGNVYIADCQNHAIRMLAPQTSNGGVPVIQSDGVIGAGSFGALGPISPGAWIEIYGTNLAVTKKSWSNADFRGTTAPTWLGGTSVTIGGQPAYISYVSGGQLNVQVPSNAGAGSQDIVISTDTGVSAAYSATVQATSPGLFAPAPFLIGGKQYVGAYFPDGSAVLPANAVTGVSSRPAKPGDIIILYGTGFGPVTPIIPAGQIAQQTNALATPLQVRIGDQPATVNYAGLAVGSVGLYQINVVVPNVSGTVPLAFTLGGTAGTQTLYLAVQ